MFEADGLVRRIYTDGRQLPMDSLPTYMGHSVGTWNGDTLLVDTVSLDGLTWIDSIGHPHSDALHVVERTRRTGANTLEIAFTFETTKRTHAPGVASRPSNFNLAGRSPSNCRARITCARFTFRNSCEASPNRPYLNQSSGSIQGIFSGLGRGVQLEKYREATGGFP